MPEELMLASCSRLAATEAERARERAARRAQREGREARGDGLGSMQGAWLAAMSKLNLDMGSVVEAMSFGVQESSGGEYAGFSAVRDWGLSIPPQKQGTANGAEFYLAEAKAKADRLPWVAKAICERLRQCKAAKLADPEWAKQELWAKQEGSFEEKAKRAGRAAFAQDWALISDWINRSENGLWQDLPEKITWGQMWRAQADWHAEMAATESSGGGSRGWQTAMAKMDKGDWQAVELNDAHMLVEEGREMSHCVSSYSGNCRQGQSRIFSVRFAGKRVCTLQLSFKEAGAAVRYRDGGEQVEAWIAQNKGAHNKPVDDPSALQFCEDVRAEYQKRLRAEVAKRKEQEALRAKERSVAKKGELLIGAAEEAEGAQPAPRRRAAPKP